MGDHWYWLPSAYWQAYVDFINQPYKQVCLKALAANAVVSHICQAEKDLEDSLIELKAPNGTGLLNYLQGQLHLEAGHSADAKKLFNSAVKSSLDQNIRQLAVDSIERIALETSFSIITPGAGKGGSEVSNYAVERAAVARALEDEQPLFEIVVTGLQLVNMLDGCLNSIGEQTYRNFRVHLLSDDDTVELSLDPAIIKKRYRLPSMPIVKVSPIRIGKAALIYDHLRPFDFQPNSVVVILDGDDRFAKETALIQFAAVYSSENPDACWSTYIRSDGVLGHSAPLIRDIPHRKQGWRSSHCFTFRANLIKRVPRSYILDESGKPVMQACDLALALPILDIATRTSFIPEALYYYTVTNPQSHHNQPDGMGLTSTRQMVTGQYLYGKVPL